MAARYRVLTALSLLAACTTGRGTPTLSGRQVSYTCDRGPPMTVIFSGDTARVEGGDGQTVIMQQRESGSGFWYESATHSLRGKGNEATYTIGRMVPLTCKTGQF